MTVTFNKRQKEKERQQRHQEKVARREDRKKQKANKPARAEGTPDPDLEGIVAGPQPIPEWD